MVVRNKKVHKIERRAGLFPAVPVTEQQKKRVAAYARVSTDQDEQLSSYEAQVDFYTRYINNNPEWEFVAVYTDEGISGTNTKKRDGFNRMVADALSGKIDLILTKSISRFARNTVDTLTTIRQLKAKGIEVYFEKENIYTLDAKGEVMITIMSSLAQEESRSISENVSWGKRRSMEEGKISMPYKSFLGYEKGDDGLPKIVVEEAAVVREIYHLFLGGKTVREIAGHLTRQGIPTPKGKQNWSVSTIMSILQNEKYKGDALLQKTYTADFLTKEVRKNKGELPQYYIENSHPAIIDPETFALVQKEIERRRPNRRQLHRSSLFDAKVICSDCGGFYGRKVWHSGSKYEKSIWRCNRKYDGESCCTTPNLDECELENSFVTAFNQFLKEKEKHATQMEKLLTRLSDTTDLEKQLDAARTEHARLIEELRSYMIENTQRIQDQGEYNSRFTEMDASCQKAEEQVNSLQKQLLEQQGHRERISCSLNILKQCEGKLEKFSPDIWNAIADTVTVSPDKTLIFRFHDSMDISVLLPYGNSGK